MACSETFQTPQKHHAKINESQVMKLLFYVNFYTINFLGPTLYPVVVSFKNDFKVAFISMSFQNFKNMKTFKYDFERLKALTKYNCGTAKNVLFYHARVP